MYTKQLADKTQYYKETPEGVSDMCKAIEEMRTKAQIQAKLEEKVDIALNFLSLGTVSIEDTAKATGLSLKDVQELANSVASNT